MAGVEQNAQVDTKRKMEPSSFDAQFLRQYTFLGRMAR